MSLHGSSSGKRAIKITVHAAYPIFLNVRDLRVLIVGGGSVAARKAAGILAAGPRELLAVAPAFCEAFPQEVTRRQRAFEEDDLKGIGLCFASTDDPGVNAHIVTLCRERGILCNRVDNSDESAGDFTVPAVHRDGAMTVAVSAGGSPALAATVRDEIAAGLNPGWGRFSREVAALRRQLMELPQTVAYRRPLLRRLSSREALAAFTAGGRDGLWRHLQAAFADLPALGELEISA